MTGSTTPLAPAVEPARWLLRWREQSPARARVVCVAHAGAGAGPFRPWADLLPDGVELHALRLPGRESRFTEPPIDAIALAIRLTADAVTPLTDGPYVLFGHCSGALVAFELARELRRRNVRPPRLLVVASQAAPSICGKDRPRADVASTADVRSLLSPDALPPEVCEDDDLLRLLEPAIRADMKMTEEYVYESEAPLETAIVAVVAAGDEELADEQRDAWRAETNEEFEVDVLPGLHFFSDEGWSALGAAVARRTEAEVEA